MFPENADPGCATDWVDKVRGLVIVAAKSVSHLTEFTDYWVHEPQWSALGCVTHGTSYGAWNVTFWSVYILRT